jgi:hypothetical protein
MSIKHEFSNIEIVRMSIDEFFKLGPVPMQRDTSGRASKGKVKKMLRVLKAPHLEISLVELKKDCRYHDKMYKKGDRLVVNGNTRMHYWINKLSDKIPAFVNCTIYQVNDMEEVREIYNMFDNPDQSERNQEKLYGILSGLFKYEPISTKVHKGEFVSALHYACNKFCPSEFGQFENVTAKLPYMVTEYIEEIKIFDSICLTPKNWDQALICSALMAIKKYGANSRLLDLLDRIDRRAVDTITSVRDGATHISVEWDKPKIFKERKSTSWTKPHGFFHTVPFVLYWMERHMSNKTQMQLGARWETTADTWFDPYHKTNNKLSALLNSPSVLSVEEHFQIEQTT